MDTNNWRPTQGATGAIGGTIGDPTMESGDWRAQLQADSRQRIVNKIMDTLKRHLPFSGQEGLQELKKIAVRFEEKIYTAATSQSDYLRKISLKMLTMETRSQNPMSDPMQSNPIPNSVNLPDPGSQVMQQVNNQGQQLSIPVQSNNIQQGQQMMPQSIHNAIGSTGMQGSSSLSSALAPGSGLQSSNITNVSGQNSNMQSIQNMSSVQQNIVGNTMTNNNFANQRPIQGRQQLVSQQQPQQQQQPQTQNSHYLYQQQFQQIANQKLQPSSMQPHIQQQQQQQQNLLQQNHMQPSQQSVKQPTMMQSPSLSTVLQNQQPVVSQSSQPLMNHQQSVLRQQRQLQAQPIQQQVQPTQQNPLGQQTNATNMQQNQLIGQQNNYSDLQQQQQQQQQQQRLIGQQNKLSGLQQPQQQLLGQHNSLSSMQQQQSGQQQQLLGNQSGNSSMQNNQHSVQQMIQSNKMPIQQHNQQNSVSLLPSQVQQSQPQLQQQVMSHMQSQPNQLQQQQVGLQQQPNLLQRDMHRLPTTGGFQQQNVIDQQKQLFQQPRAMPEASSTSLDSTAQTGNPNGGDWQEEVYQKIKAMKDLYLLDLSDMHQKILSKLQQHDSLPQQPKNEQFEKLKVFKNMLERFMQFLQIPKHGILANYKDKLGTYEKQIINVINSNRRKPAPPQQQAQALPPPHMQSLQPSQQTHSQLTQVQSHDQMNLQGSMAPMQPNNMANLQHSPVSLSGGSNAQQNIMNSIQPNSNLDPGQNNSMTSLQQVSNGSLQQNTVSGPQQVNINPMSLQANSNMLQHQHIKQQEQLLQNQQLKQFQQRQMQQQYLHKQQLMHQQHQQQQFHQQTKQQLSGNQLSQLPQISDGGDIKLRQQMNVKPGGFQQHHATVSAASQRSAYHQQLKPGAPFSPQLLSAASPQMSQHASPQIDQSNMFKSASSPFTVPSPSTSSASPLPGDFDRINGVSSLSNVGNIGHQQPSSSVLPNQIGTPGISASPLLAEFTSPDGNHGVVPSLGPGKSTVTEQPLERLLKAVKSCSPATLSAAVSDIGSVVSMIDRIAGSAPGNGSRAAVGEDLVAMTKCRLQVRNFVNQDGTNGVRKMKRFTSAMPLNVVSSTGSVNDSFKQLNVSETSELDSTASSVIKRPRTETNHALLEEIKEINRGLIDTEVAISDEDVDPAAVTAAASEGGDGTVVKCSFSGVALGPNLKSQYASAQMSPIQPLRLLVPANYPNCSPMLLDKFPAEVSKEFEDLSTKTKSRFSISLRSLSQPMSLKEIARTWDVCARAVIAEYAQQTGGGTFSSKYGTWENCLTAA